MTKFESISSSPLSSLGLMNCRTWRVCDMNVYVRATEADVYSCERAGVSSHEPVGECVNGMCERWRERGREDI